MNLRYKKAILLSLLSTLGMGMLTLSILPGFASREDSRESANIVSDDGSKPNNNSNDNKDNHVSQSPSITALPTRMPVYNFEKNGYEDITALIIQYYNAKLKCDDKTMKTLLSDPKQVESKATMKKDIMFIEGYRNIKCYVKKSYRDNEYIVFVSHSIKFYNIKTTASALDEFYIVKDTSGKVKIFSGKYDVKTEQYYHDRIKDADVVKIIKEVNKKIEEARKNDKKFKEFWDGFLKKKTTKKK